MKFYRCIKAFWFEENDGNGDIKVHVFLGQVFFVDCTRDLPNNFNLVYTDHFEEIVI